MICAGCVAPCPAQLRPLAVSQYVNETMFLDHHQDAAGCYEEQDYARLQALKVVCDPHNTFRSL